jgi:predicted small secreted protein
MMKRVPSLLVLVATLLVLSSCASQKGSGTGIKILEGVVVDRGQDAPGSGGSGYQGAVAYYLVFEVRDGEALARYRYSVSYQQWFRFPEGSHVRITLNNNFLQDVRPNE